VRYEKHGSAAAGNKSCCGTRTRQIFPCPPSLATVH